MNAPLTSRRTLLQGAAMLTAAPAAALGAAPLMFREPKSPIVRLFHQWEAAQEEECAAHRAMQGEPLQTIDRMEGEIYATLGEKRRGIEAAIIAEAVTDLRDLAVKVLVNSGEGSFALDDVLTLECAQIADRDFDKLPRCLFEQA